MDNTSLSQLKKDLDTLANKKHAQILQRFFKTGKGEYGEGDVFLGLKVPVLRNLAKQYRELSLEDTVELLQSKYHEHRITALFILVLKYSKVDQKGKEEIVHIYLGSTQWINNWDLVDLSAPNIIGDYFLDKKRDILYRLAVSNNLWERRIAILATFTFIRNNEYKDTLKISGMLLNDKHDLIHKAVGWMLREVGKRVSKEKEKEFLDKYYRKMPRTMLRYAIEHFSENEKKKYMSKD
jgi:3-methyladenine DNA glycosylase AlkD